MSLGMCGIVTRLVPPHGLNLFFAGLRPVVQMEADMNATELIKRGIAMAPFVVSVIAYALLLSAQQMPW